ASTVPVRSDPMDVLRRGPSETSHSFAACRRTVGARGALQPPPDGEGPSAASRPHSLDWRLSNAPAVPMSEILVPVSFGELLDKIAILQIKSERMSDEAKLANVRKELSALEQTWMAHPAAGGDIAQLRAQLKAVNERLWDIEDEIRLKERAQEFDEEFVRLARSVYFENDE